MGKHIGILTSGGDCPGLNAAIRGFGKAAIAEFGMDVIGFRDGFRGLVQDRTVRLDIDELSGILTDGGTILGTSRDKPHKMPVGDKQRDMTDAAVATYKKHGLDCLVCLGGGGTQKNALRLQEAGINVITLPKTIDNDVALTDTTFGFDTALQIATDGIDRLHSTATSHQRSIVVEIMGHRAGWLALGAGIAGGADVVLIPEIPYDIECVAKAIRARSKAGKRFSIVAVAEGAMSREQKDYVDGLVAKKKAAKNKDERRAVSKELAEFHDAHTDHTLRLTHELEKLTGQESRLTILGHLLRGGTPSAYDRLLSTRLGTQAAALAKKEVHGVMLAVRGTDIEAVGLSDVAGNKKLVPPDHPWVQSARRVGTSFGD